LHDKGLVPSTVGWTLQSKMNISNKKPYKNSYEAKKLQTDHSPRLRSKIWTSMDKVPSSAPTVTYCQTNGGPVFVLGINWLAS